MSEKILIVTNDEKIEMMDYTDYQSIQKAVNGSFQLLAVTKIGVNPIYSHGKYYLDVCLFCNENFLIDDDEEFDKINAFGSALTGQEIRGNVAILIDTLDCDNRGFEYLEEEKNGKPEEALCECWAAKQSIEQHMRYNEKRYAELHKKYDKNKGNPEMSYKIF